VRRGVGVRKKIYYLLSECPYLEPTSGDRITEINLIKSLSINYDVYYNDILYLNNFDSGQNKVNMPSRKYDFYIVRNNPKVFNALKNVCGKKIYFGVPYNEQAFDAADYISVFTDSWRDKLISGYRFPHKAYPEGYTTDKAISMKQCVGDEFFNLKKSYKSKKIRKDIGGSFIIGHFGRTAESCYPYLLEKCIDRIKEAYPFVSFVFAGSAKGKNRKRFENKHIAHRSYSYDDMPYAISACDLILYNYNDAQGSIAGSMKILEAMACGVPIISPRYDAREDELGRNYTYFHKYESIKNIDTGKLIKEYSSATIEEYYRTIEAAINDPELSKRCSRRLVRRAESYKIGNHSEYIRELLEGLT
jgi:glycosyltransferase involved in cell wall biosynthesis